MKKRDQVLEKYKMNTKDLFESEKEFLEEIEKLKEEIKEISKYEGKLLSNSKTLLEMLDLSEELDKRIEKVYIYAHLNNDMDLGDTKGNEYYGVAYKLNKEYGTLSSYVVPELLEHDYKEIDDYIKENEDLKKYENSLKEIFRLKSHMLSKNEEYILTKLSDTFTSPEDIYSKLTDVDLKFGTVKDEDGNEVELTESNWATFIESKNRDVRKNVFEKFFTAYKSIINTTSELLSSEVKKNNAISQIRKYDSAMQRSLDANDVSPKVYEKLISSIEKNLKTVYRQWSIRKEKMKLDELHLYDTYVPLTEEFDKKYTYEEASKMILDSLKVMGEDYVNTLSRAFSEKWIDVMPNENKRGGAYCTCCYLTHPYVMTNFNERYGDVSTITHELGHAMHYYYAQTNNIYCDYGYSIFVAEVASQVNEILLALHVLNISDNKEEKIFILDTLMKHFKSSVVRQAMFAEFEKNVHESEQNGEILTPECLCNKYYELNKKYFGNDVIVDDKIRYEWSRIPHFYYNFYVYQYSTGYIAALKIAYDIFNGNKQTLDNYLEFLKLGSTKDPVESLKVAGVDLTKDDVYDEAFGMLNEQMDEFEKLIREE
ncbi:MAG: oligoendopeptidase F [Firmicutes bacterium]|nr:oligoendopeptidase F [Bacillota bacterium]